MRIAVLADTHDHLPEKVCAQIAAADEIWHLGDVCAPAILQRLRTVGPPVRIVRGNCDSTLDWPLTLDLERAGFRLRLVHIPARTAPPGTRVPIRRCAVDPAPAGTYSRMTSAASWR